MTLVLSLTDSHRAMQFSDRRLTSASTGEVVEDNAAKASLVICSDARALMGFSGLATIGRETTQRWLLTNVVDQQPSMDRVLEGLREALTKRFTVLFGIPPSYRRLSVLLNGFAYSPCTDPVPAISLISNFEDPAAGPAVAVPWPEFRVRSWIGKGGSSEVFTLAVGCWHSVDLAELEALKQLMAAGVPDKGVLGKGVKLMLKAAKSPVAQGTIGTDLMTAVLPADPQAVAAAAFVPEHAKRATYFLDHAIVGRLATSDAMVEPVQQETLPTAVPVVPRNRPCPCGSGHKYKHCHSNWSGRPRGPKLY